MQYITGSCVCDYGVYETYYDRCGKPHKKLTLICNSLDNAKLICNIMNTDLKHEKYQCQEVLNESINCL